MHTKFRVKYLARRTLLTFLGPAHLDEHNDPMNELERERAEVLGPRKEKAPRPHVRRRHFTDTANRIAHSSR